MAQKTPLYDKHVAAGGQMVDFGGWLMPIQYTGIREEHTAVRTACGLFDVSHMGEFRLKGKECMAFLDFLVSNTAQGMEEGQIHYSPMCFPDGGVVDDLLYYKLHDGEFLIVANAANIQKDWDWMNGVVKERGFNVTLENESNDTALLALQGPRAKDILAGLTDVKLDSMKYYYFTKGTVEGVNTMLSRTGYTGEDGFEIFYPAKNAPALWEALMQAGKEHGLKPTGLGARDTLRLEACMPLYGNDLDEKHTPLEAGLGRFVALEKKHFNGKAVMEKQKAQGVPTKLVAFVLDGKGIPRHDYLVYAGGTKAGVVSSGTFSPTLEKGIGMCYVPAEHGEIGGKLGIEIRGQKLPATIVKKPFYKRKKEGA